MASLKDFATGTVLTAPSPATSGLSLVLNSGEGARMPAVPFYVVAHPVNELPTLDNAEKLLVTAKATDTLTITRAQGSTTAKSIAVGWRISNAVFLEDLFTGSLVQGETPSGSINSSNTVFTVASAFTSGSLRVFLNGQRLKAGSGNDYQESAALTGFTMEYAPTTGDVLLVDYNIGNSVYMNGTNSFINQETPTGSVNGSNAVFTTARAYVAGSVQVYVNGVLQAPTTHVTETSPTAGTITLDTAPLTGDIVRVSYQYAASAGGNADTLDGYHANATPTANQIPVLDGNAVLPVASMGGAWDSWTPTLSGRPNNTKWNKACKYTQIGKTITCKLNLIANTTTPMDGGTADVIFTLPVTSAPLSATGNIQVLGTVNMFDATGNIYLGLVTLASTTTAVVRGISTGGASAQQDVLTSTLPFTWTTSDEISGSFTYEAA